MARVGISTLVPYSNLKAIIPAAKHVKRPRITPTSRINDLEVVIAALENRLSAAEAKLETVIEPTPVVGQPQDISHLLEAEEAWEKQWEVE